MDLILFSIRLKAVNGNQLFELRMLKKGTKVFLFYLYIKMQLLFFAIFKMFLNGNSN